MPTGTTFMLQVIQPWLVQVRFHLIFSETSAVMNVINGLLRSRSDWPHVRWYLIVSNMSIDMADHVLRQLPRE